MDETKYCLVEFNATVLSRILQLPPYATIDAAWVALDRPGVVVMRIRGAGTTHSANNPFPMTVAAYEHDDGKIKWRAPIDWPRQGPALIETRRTAAKRKPKKAAPAKRKTKAKR